MKTKLLSYILLLLLSLVSVAAADFNAGATHKTLGLCSCGTYQNDVLVTNADSDVVTLAVEQVIAPQWVTTFPPQVTLRPGESSKFSQLLEVACDAEGSYPLKTTIKSHNGIQKQVVQEMKVGQCHNTKVKLDSSTIESCPCKPTDFTFTLLNSGIFEETYLLNASPYSDFVSMSFENVTLGPQETKEITVTVSLPCDVMGLQTINLIVHAVNNDLVSQFPLDYQINACYDFEVTLPEEIDVCAAVNNVVPLEISNKGDIKNFYEVDLNVPWAELDNSTVKVQKQSTEIVGITLVPPKGIEQAFDLTTTITSTYGRTEKVITTPVTLNQCYDIALDVDNLRACEGEDNTIEFVMTNTGIKEKTITVETWGFEWLSARIEQATLAPGEESKVIIEARPPLGSAGTKDITLAIATTDDENFQQLTQLTVVPEEGCRLVGIYTDANLYVNYEKKQIPFVIENRGLRTETYTLSLDAGAWVDLEKRSITLAPKEKEVLYFEVHPVDIPKGDYNINLFVSPTEGEATYAKTFVVSVGKSPLLWWFITGGIALVILLTAGIIAIVNKRREKNIVTISLLRDHEDAETKSSWILPGIILVGLLILSGFIYALINHYEVDINLFYFYGGYVLVTMVLFLWFIISREKKQPIEKTPVIRKVAKKPKKAAKKTTKKTEFKKPENVKDVVENFKKMEHIEKKRRAKKKATTKSKSQPRRGKSQKP